MGIPDDVGHADNLANPDDLWLCVLCWVVVGCWRGCSPLLLACHPPRCKLFFLLHHAIPVVPNDIFCMFPSAQRDSFAIFYCQVPLCAWPLQISIVNSCIPRRKPRIPLFPLRLSIMMAILAFPFSIRCSSSAQPGTG